MSINSSLQALVTKMGGTALETDTNVDLLGKIVVLMDGEVSPDDTTTTLVAKIVELYSEGSSDPEPDPLEV